MDERETYRKLLYRYLKLEYLYERYPYDRDTIDAFFELMLDVICSKRTTIRIAGDDKPTQVVRSQLLKLNMKHIEYILECMKNNTSKVRNIKQYMLAMIYNAPMTMNSYYEQMVNHDMAEGLIPESVYVYTSATCGKKKKKQYSTPFGVYTYRDVPVEVFPYGTKLCEENGYGFVIATAEKAICDTLYTCSPCANKRELRQLLFDDPRIDQTTFTSIDLNELAEVAGLYHTSNHRLLISLIKEIRRHE